MIYIIPLKTNFKTYTNILRQTIREAKKQYYHRIFFNFKNNIKKTWIAIKETLNRNNKTTKLPSVFYHNNQIIQDPTDLANAFNDYFINIGTTLSQHIESDTSHAYYLKNNYSNLDFKFKQINESHILTIIKKLKIKFSSGLDCISNNLIKHVSDVISKPLTLIVNQMLITGIFPNKLKTSKVIPIFKKGDDTSISNYRPISLLSSLSKIFEHVIADQLTEYLISHNLLCSEQFGFRTGYSTELAALQLVDKMINQVDEGNIPLNIYIDLSKAFDTLDHKILAEKLSYYGINNTNLNLFKNYLSNRDQLTEINGIQSNLQRIKQESHRVLFLGHYYF